SGAWMRAPCLGRAFHRRASRIVMPRMTDAASATAAPPSIPAPLFAMALLYGGMTCIAGVLGAKQVALGSLAVEAGIFPFLLLVALSSAVARIFGRATADRLGRVGLLPLVPALARRWFVLRLATDHGLLQPGSDAG